MFPLSIDINIYYYYYGDTIQRYRFAYPYPPLLYLPLVEKAIATDKYILWRDSCTNPHQSISKYYNNNNVTTNTNSLAATSFPSRMEI